MIDKQDVLDRLDRREYYGQYFPQARSGRKEITVCSPFREEDNPSFSVNLVNGLWHDHATGEGGDVFTFEQRKSRCDFPIAVKNIARFAGITLAKKTGTQMNGTAKRSLGTQEDALRWNATLLGPHGERARVFLNSRGLADDTLRKFLVGYDDKRKAVVIPLALDGDEIVSLKEMFFNGTGWKTIKGKKDFKLQGSSVLYCAKLIQDVQDVLVCEGELDCLFLRQNGFDAVTGGNGAGTWKDEWTDLLKGKTVTLVYDSDEIGRKGALKPARALHGIARDVRSVDLYPKNDGSDKDRKDVTDFFIKDGRTIEEFRTLLENAVTVQPEEKPSALALLKDLGEQLEICPAQDYVDGVFYYAVRVQGKPHLVTSKKECFSFEDSPNDGLMLSRGQVDKFRFSAGGLHSFLAGDAVLNQYALFKRIRSYIRRYIVFRDPDCFDFLALWVMGTYIFRAFRYYPYIHVIGEKQSGKTLLMDVLAPIAFNGELSSNSTEAVLFRDVQNNQLTLMLDEVERFKGENKERYGAVMDVLKTGFSKSGLVKRCGGKNMDQIHSFRTYSPKILAGINEIDDVLRDRTIRLQMVRRLPSEPVDRYRENKATESEQREIRDQLYTFGLVSGPEIAEIYQNNLEEIDGLEHLSNREYDIWAPIILLANCVDAARDGDATTDMAIRFSARKVEERRTDDCSDNQTSRLLVALNAMLQEETPVDEDGETLTFDTETAFKFFQNQDEFAWLEKKGWLTRNLRRLEVRPDVKKIGRKTTRVYRIDKSKLRDLTDRYLGSDGPLSPDESVTVTEAVTTVETKEAV